VGAVIHNSADISHLKSYYDLRPRKRRLHHRAHPSVPSRKTAMHFVSFNAVGRYWIEEVIGEVAINLLNFQLGGVFCCVVFGMRCPAFHDTTSREDLHADLIQ
jgi:hypothetical protein